VSLIINAEATQQTRQELDMATGGNVDTDYAVVLGFPCEIG
jgi:hypothetical protein